MTENNLAKRVINKIKAEQLAPRPRWHFLLKSYVIYLSGVLALIFSALGVSVLIFLFKNNSWSMANLGATGLWGYILMTTPYFWLLFLALFIFILYYNLKHLKKGYRYPLRVIILLSFLSSIVLGEAFYLLGFGEKLDERLGASAPLYQEILNPQLNFWFQPESGRLVGLVSRSSDGLELIDPSGHSWQLVLEDELLVWSEIASGEPVNVFGYIESDGVFRAQVIKPVRAGRAFMERPGRRACPLGAPCQKMPGRHFRN